MGVVGWIVLVGYPLLLLFVILEGRRQEKKQKTSRGTASRMMRAGFLEMQTLLEPEKKVEMLREDRQQDLLIVVDPSADPPTGGKGTKP